MHDEASLRALKARYCRELDAKAWDAWRSVFTDDFVSDTREAGGRIIVGADAFVAFVRAILGTRITLHRVSAPEIELTSDTTARGTWALEDSIRWAPGISVRGRGHYHETYEKRGGEWRIQSSKLTRVRMDVVTPIVSLGIPLWLMKRAGG